MASGQAPFIASVAPVGRSTLPEQSGNDTHAAGPSPVCYLQNTSTTIHELDLIEDTDGDDGGEGFQSGCPKWVTDWVEEVKHKVNKSGGLWRYVAPDPTTVCDASLSDFLRTTLYLWDPSTTWSYLFPKPYMPCPFHGYKGTNGGYSQGLGLPWATTGVWD